MSEKIRKSLPYLTIFTVLLALTLMFVLKQRLFAQDVNGGTPASITSVSSENSSNADCIPPGGGGTEDCVTSDVCDTDPCASGCPTAGL